MRDARDPEDLFGTEPVVLPRRVLAEQAGQALRRAEGDHLCWTISRRTTTMSRGSGSAPGDALYQQAQTRIEIGAYNLQGRGQRRSRSMYRSQFFDAGSRRYYIGPRFRQGDETTLYNGYLEVEGAVLGEVLLKVAHLAGDLAVCGAGSQCARR